MSKRNNNKILTFAASALFVLIIVLSAVYFIIGNAKSKNMVTLDRPDYYPSDSAIPYYTLKWMENIKFSKRGLLKEANIQTINEGVVTRISFKKGEINIDRKTGLSYPFVVRIELNDPAEDKSETLYFSQTRYDMAQIFRLQENGQTDLSSWEDIKVGDIATIEENVNLLESNVDSNNKFTDKYLKSLTIHLQ